MAEWLKAHAWKACLGETLTWVRIPLSPPVFKSQPNLRFRELIAIFERFLLLRNVRVPCFAVLDSGEFHGKPRRNSVTRHPKAHPGIRVLSSSTDVAVDGFTLGKITDFEVEPCMEGDAFVMLRMEVGRVWLGKFTSLRTSKKSGPSTQAGGRVGRGFLLR
jgi:hypothetical protein